jgi:two-component system CheB/CheR fusion protein
VEVADTGVRQPGRAEAGGAPRVAELEHELDATRTELEGAIHNLEASSEEQKAMNEEALSVNEEYQSANEELLTSKEELQSLNEELTALNTQLQETLERQRTTSTDLQNVLYSTDVATIFLDRSLKIRFFTPATKSLFNVIPGDIGRPLADLNSLAADGALLADAASVLESFVPIEREIRAQTGTWYVRRILPYRAHGGAVEGIVVTFVDITERKVIADALAAAEQQAQMANLAKSRFLAAASHDLRQPLQALSLMRGVLAKKIRENKNDEALVLVEGFEDTAATMSGMLNTMLDINQIEAGVVTTEVVSFRINDMLERLRAEFAYHAESRGLLLKVVKCSLTVMSDPRLLEQIIRNLLSNALKYTPRGKVLIGCRRHDGMVSIEICDTGVGIPNSELQAIFEEYRQLGNAAHEHSRGLGLGLSIVKRLADLLGHKVSVRSRLGKGSVFAVDVALPPGRQPPSLDLPRRGVAARDNDDTALTGAIMVIDDDPEVRRLLALVLTEEGHRVYTARDGLTALQLAAGDMIRPDVILTDYNLPGELNGIGLSAKLRQELGRDIPIIVLTGDISTDALREIGRADCVQLNKPVNPEELTRIIRRLLLHAADEGQRKTRVAGESTKPGTIFVVDDDARLLDAIRGVLEEDGRAVETYRSAEGFLGAYRAGHGVCLLLDAYLPEMSGLDLLRQLQAAHDPLPAIMITGHSDVPIAVEAMRAGAVDFIEKPIGRQQLLDTIERALDHSQTGVALAQWREAATRHMSKLTPRERQIMELVLAGQSSKNIAADLGVSQRTVENHRAAVMRKTGSTSLPALARLALAAAWHGGGEPFLVAATAIE